MMDIVMKTYRMVQYCLCNEMVNSEVLIIVFNNLCLKMDLIEMRLKNDSNPTLLLTESKSNDYIFFSIMINIVNEFKN